MSDKPTYLGLLNAIAVAESTAHRLVVEWAAVTQDPAVRKVLLAVGAREGEHAMTFARRVNELGYELRERRDEVAEHHLEVIRSNCSDIEKFETIGVTADEDTGEPDIFESYFRDHSIDSRTGELLGRFIAEERESERMLKSCYRDLLRAAGGSAERQARL